jgi:hypothetical protein
VRRPPGSHHSTLLNQMFFCRLVCEWPSKFPAGVRAFVWPKSDDSCPLDDSRLPSQMTHAHQMRLKFAKSPNGITMFSSRRLSYERSIACPARPSKNAGNYNAVPDVVDAHSYWYN